MQKFKYNESIQICMNVLELIQQLNSLSEEDLNKMLDNICERIANKVVLKLATGKDHDLLVRMDARLKLIAGMDEEPLPSYTEV